MSASITRNGATLLCAATVALSACASRGPSERAALRLDQFEAAASAPVDAFVFWSLDKWESLGETELAVWTRPNEAYLLRVERPCGELEWAHAIGLTSNLQRVHARFDSVIAGGQRCRILEIRPVDAARVRHRPDAGS